MERIIKELSGFSGSKIYLMENDMKKLFVRKIGNIERNYERMVALSQAYYPVPEIYWTEHSILDMEYIHGLDMRSYLIDNTVNDLSDFLIGILSGFKKSSKIKDVYGRDEMASKVYENNRWINRLPIFNMMETLMESARNVYTHSFFYHGDMTLENIIKSKDQFVLIDPVTVDYDSYVFDIAKLRQDLNCKWFLRRNSAMLDGKLNELEHNILEEFPEANDDNLLILMLLRVLKHAPVGSMEYEFLMKEINRLWK